jgi:hypothetical protein
MAMSATAAEAAESDSADWTFGSGGFAKLYGDRLAESSLLDRDVATRWVFVFMLAGADAEGRFRCASVAGLARAAAVTKEQAERAVAELEAPDPDSTTKLHEGRRILRIAGGWQIVAYGRYRDYRSSRQVAAAERQRRHRERDMSRDVTPSNAPDVRRKTSDTRQQNNGERTSAPNGAADRPMPKTRPRKATATAARIATDKALVKTDDGNGAGIETPAVVLDVEVVTGWPKVWSREACDDWVARFGGTAPGGQIGKAFKPLERVNASWPEVRGAWRNYLDQAEAEFASASRFAQTLGRWTGSVPPGKSGRTSVEQKNRAAIGDWLRRG